MNVYITFVVSRFTFLMVYFTWTYTHVDTRTVLVVAAASSGSCALMVASWSVLMRPDCVVICSICPAMFSWHWKVGSVWGDMFKNEL